MRRGRAGRLRAHSFLPAALGAQDPERILFLGGSRFRLLVPRVHLLGTWIEPQVEVSVRNEPDAVVLQADRWGLLSRGQLSRGAASPRDRACARPWVQACHRVSSVHCSPPH